VLISTRRTRPALAIAAATTALLASTATVAVTAAPATAAPVTAAPVTAAPAAAAAAPAAHAPRAVVRTDFGFLRRSYVRKGTRYLVLDRAELLTGEAARRARKADGKPADGLDYYIRNRNPRLRAFPVSPQVRVLGSQALTGSPSLERVSLRRLLDALARSPRQLPPFHLTLRGGVVVEVREQYLP
jgi:hypothetical protein